MKKFFTSVLISFSLVFVPIFGYFLYLFFSSINFNKELYPRDAYSDDRFFITRPYFQKSEQISNNQDTSSEISLEYCSFSLYLGNFFEEDNWKALMYLSVFDEEDSKSFFCEVSDIGSSYYKAKYVYDWLDLGSDIYTYEAPKIFIFTNQISNSFFETKYKTILFTMKILKGNETYGTFSSFGTVKYKNEELYSIAFERLTKNDI